MIMPFCRLRFCLGFVHGSVGVLRRRVDGIQLMGILPVCQVVPGAAGMINAYPEHPSEKSSITVVSHLTTPCPAMV